MSLCWWVVPCVPFRTLQSLLCGCWWEVPVTHASSSGWCVVSWPSWFPVHVWFQQLDCESTEFFFLIYPVAYSFSWACKFIPLSNWVVFRHHIINIFTLLSCRSPDGYVWTLDVVTKVPELSSDFSIIFLYHPVIFLLSITKYIKYSLMSNWQLRVYRMIFLNFKLLFNVPFQLCCSLCLLLTSENSYCIIVSTLSFTFLGSDNSTIWCGKPGLCWSGVWITRHTAVGLMLHLFPFVGFFGILC